MATYYERSGSRTEQRSCRRMVRNVLGTSSDSVPGAERVIRAAHHLDRLLELTTDGWLRLSLERGRGADKGEPVGWQEALRD